MAQGIAIRAIHIPGCLNLTPDRLSQTNQPTTTERSPRGLEPNIRDTGHSNCGYVCHSPQHLSSSVYVTDSRALITGDRYSVTGLAGTVDVHVSTVSPA